MENDQASLPQLDVTLRVMRRRWVIIAICVVVAPASALGFSLAQQKQYSATAGLLFRDAGLDQKLFGTTVLPTSPNADREAATNVRLVSLKAVANRTSRALRGRSTPEQVQSKIEVSQEGQSDVVAITATDPSPEFAARLANLFAGEFIEFRRAADRAKIRGAQVLIQRQLARLTPRQSAGEDGRSLRSRAEKLSILASLQTGNAELVQAADVPTSPSSPKPLRNTVLGLAFGLLLGIGLALLLDRLDRRIRDIDELEEAYSLPVLVGIPESTTLTEQKRNSLLPFTEVEAFRMLRARLRYFNVDHPIRSVMITSVGPDEGKSTVSWNLALAAATSGESRVLLIETDLRRPKLARRFDLKPFPGLAEVLSHEVEFDDVIQQVEVPQEKSRGGNGKPPQLVDVVIAGAHPPNPAELLESRRMAELLERLYERYDFVVLDTPPTSVVSDSIPLIGRVDGVIVVSRIGRSSRPGAVHLADQLKRLSANTLGIVANRLSSTRGGSGYYYYDYGQDYAPESPGSVGMDNEQTPSENGSDKVSIEPAGESSKQQS